jgi:hypothetical protein
VGVPLRFLVAAAAAFVMAALGIVWLAPALAGHYYQPRLVGLTHAVTLGWITLTIMGASYQLVPVVLGRLVWSERLARWQFWVLALGVSGMVAHFFIGTWPGLLMAAALLALGVGAHLLNMLLTLRGLGAWTFTARLIVLAYAGLALTTVFGLALGADRMWRFLPGPFFPTLQAHFHLALLGWIAPMIFGVGARVYPMFLLAPEPGGWPERIQFWGLAAGVPAVVAGLLAWPALVLPGALAVAGAAAGHLVWLATMARRRRRPGLDWGLRFVLTGAAFIPAAGLVGLGFAAGLLESPREALAYAILALGGWVSLTIAGMMLKIVPFLVWYRVYAPLAGRAPVPTLAGLSWPRGEALAYALLTGGVALLAIAVAAGDIAWIRSAGALLALGALAFGATLARVLHHLAARPVMPGSAAMTRAATR